MPRVLLVGAGLTSAAIACRLADLPVKLSCWDRARKPGSEYILLHLPPPTHTLALRLEQKLQVYYMYLIFLHKLKFYNTSDRYCPFNKNIKHGIGLIVSYLKGQ